jgi:tetratricopeptide (TPR) repeat protein
MIILFYLNFSPILFCSSKVRAVVVKRKELIAQIKADENARSKIEEPITLTVFTAAQKSEQSTTELNGNFLHSLLLIDALLRLKPDKNDKKELVSFCHKECKDDDDMDRLSEFAGKYSPDQAIRWYTYESPLYKKLNEALRTQNIQDLLLFRFFIGDIYEQLKKYQYKEPVQVYRGQIMSIKEFKKLERSVGNLISCNSFFSTTRKRKEALKFMKIDKTSDSLCPVLFIIDADPSVVTTKPFADIQSLSALRHEAEVLFMIACVFRLTKICEGKDQIQEIHMELCGDDVHDLKELYEHMKEEYWGDDDEIDLLTFGEVLYHMGEYKSATKVFSRLSDELPSNDPSRSKLYFYLGMMNYKKEDYDLSLKWYHDSLEMILKTQPSNYTNIGELYNCIGEAHRVKNDYKQALLWLDKGIDCFKKEHHENHPTMGTLYNNIGLIYQEQQKYDEALNYYKKSLAVNEKHLPSDHPDMAKSHHNISIVYGYLKEYDLAMEHHNKSLEIKLKAFPSTHSSIADSYQCIGCLYYDKGEWKQALKYFEKASDIYHCSFTKTHPKVIRIQENIQRVKSKLK